MSHYSGTDGGRKRAHVLRRKESDCRAPARATAARGARRYSGLRLLALAPIACGLGHAMPAQANVVSACSGVSLPKSVLTDTIGNVLVPVLSPVESILSTLTLGTVNLGISSTLASVASGAPITLNAVDINGNAIDLLSDPVCDTTSDSYSLNTPKGISFGGNKITGLGAPGLAASAGELDAIAIGNLASTSVGAFGAVAIGANAVATHSGSVALGSNSIADGATLNTPAYLLGGTASAEVNIGGRRLSGLAAGAAPTDAVNVAQLTVVNDALVNLADNSVVYDSVTKDLVTFQGATGTRLANVANGVNPMDAVNVSQLTTVSDAVTGLTDRAVQYDGAAKDLVTLQGASGTRITNLADGVNPSDAVNMGQLTTVSDTVTGLADRAVQYDGAAKDLVTFQGASGTRLTNVADGIDPTDAVNMSQLTTIGDTVTGLADRSVQYDGAAKDLITLQGASGTRITNLADGVAATDAVNMGQLAAVSDSVTGLSDRAVQYDNAARDLVTFQGASGTRLTNIAAGTLGATSTDAVNGSQLYATNNAVAQNSAAITQLSYDFAALSQLAVKYQDLSKSTIALEGAGGTQITNVAPGVAPTDSANVSQLNALAGSINNVAQDALPYDQSKQAYDAARGGVDQRITGIAAGDVSASSSDAVNGAQLYATNVQLAYNTTAITDLQNGRAGYFQVNNSSGYATPVASGADSVAAGAGAMASGANSMAIGTRAQAFAEGSIALGYGSIADRANAVSIGSMGAERQIIHVADGISPTDAVNLRQLQSGMGQAVLEANAYTDVRISQISWGLKDLRADAEAGTAASMAMSGIPQSMEPGGGMLGFGMSTWQGEHAIAMGFSKASDNGRIMIRAAATYNSRNQGGANAGFGIAF